MKELTEYRQRLLERLVESAKSFRAACLDAQEPFAPLEPGGWNVHQTAAHTRDVNELVYGSRARRTVEEENPEFANFDGDAYMAEQYKPEEPLGAMLDGFVTDVESLAAFLRQLSPEAWSRQSRHATMGGGFTLQIWVERSLAHIEEHIESLARG